MSQIESQQKYQYLPEEMTITPIRGYREWSFIIPEGRVMSLWDKSRWPVDEPHVAKCKLGCTEIPCEQMGTHGGFGCGLYAWHRPESACPNKMAMSVGFRSNPKYWGVVETEGVCRVIKHKRGFRASNLRIVAIASSSRHSHLVAKAYGVPCLSYSVLIREYPPQIPWSMDVI